ncbi:hypothetical protein [Arcobacter peruensis]|uniref:hypothetical protein n=1 Tax=Arcobacter peruensis TaxID=2320140 RepID=UPI000F07B7B0|nr:hypothetical protein [Arcobacter peruensis]
MESIIAIEELINQTQKQIDLQNLQLKRHYSGEGKLSSLILASTENTLEVATKKLDKYNKILKRLLGEDGKKLNEEYRLRIASKRKRYFDTQDSRIKANKEHSSDIKLAAIRILGELPQEIELDDEDLFEIAVKSAHLTLPELNELSKLLDTIRIEFNSQLEKNKEEDIKQIATLDYLIPIVILHFKILRDNISQSIHDKNLHNQELLKEGKIENFEKKKFSTWPKYQDWWVRELWVSHQAYFSLFKWKEIINKQCQTTEQKKAWSIIYDRWITIKKLLNDKGTLAFHYHYVFDKLIEKYAKLEEEMDEEKMNNIEKIYLKLSKKEDFEKNSNFHNIITPYYKYKKSK